LAFGGPVATRQTLQRELVTVETAFGAIRVKVARMNGRTLNVGAGVR
jgi:uncharacterized protein (DUF111 family)